MNISPRIPDAVRTLWNRSSFVCCLAEGIDDKREIQQKLDVSRTTVDRAFIELEDAGVVTSTGSEYDLSPYGKLLFEEYRRFFDRCNDIRAVQTLLAYLPSETTLDRCVLNSATVHHASRSAPQKPLDALEGLLQRSERLEGRLPVVVPRTVANLHRQVMTTDVEVQLVFEAESITHLSDNHGEKLHEILTADGVEVRCSDSELPFGLVVGNDETWLGGYDTDGSLKGAIVNDDEAAVEWATETV
jgi:predicted transcriptional regulator